MRAAAPCARQRGGNARMKGASPELEAPALELRPVPIKGHVFVPPTLDP